MLREIFSLLSAKEFLKKSPAKSTVIPPIISVEFRMSCKVLFSASNPPLCAMVLSSQTINLQSFKTLAALLCLDILHVGLSFDIKFSGSLKAECAVFPPSERVAAIPDDATANAIPDLLLLHCRIHVFVH